MPGLTVRENLRLGLHRQPGTRAREARDDRRDRRDLSAPEGAAATRKAPRMSGGEQQMLAIARAMMARPKMILLDEPSEGIMPLLVDEMFELFARMKQRRHDHPAGRAERRARAAHLRPRLHPRPGAVVHTGSGAAAGRPAIQERTARSNRFHWIGDPSCWPATGAPASSTAASNPLVDNYQHHDSPSASNDGISPDTLPANRALITAWLRKNIEMQVAAIGDCRAAPGATACVERPSRSGHAVRR